MEVGLRFTRGFRNTNAFEIERGGLPCKDSLIWTSWLTFAGGNDKSNR